MQRFFALTDKVAVVTGGSRGIGEAIASAFAGAGARLVLAGRKAAPLEEVVERLQSAGTEVIGVATNCGRPEDLERLMAAAVERFGGIDVLVNNAATSPHFGRLIEATDGEWRKTIEVNLLGYAHAARLAANIMRGRGGGKILNVTSVAAERSLAGLGVYGVSKAAVSAMTRTLALELASQNIQVNAIAPGIIKTRFSRALWDDPEIAGQALSRIPAGRFGEPGDVVGAALYLASPASDYTTGLVMTIDGGFTIG